jgi:uncharacterized membrane protein YphA (DoxX/SURF4 family)
MKNKMTLAARVFLGIIYFVFGLNGFLGFLPMPPMEGPSGAFAGALANTGYFFPFLKGTEVVMGLLLIAGKFVPLALAVLAPITINIFLFHLFLGIEGLPIGIVLVVLNAFLAYLNKDAYSRLLSPA